jgi:hypothetical protein
MSEKQLRIFRLPFALRRVAQDDSGLGRVSLFLGLQLEEIWGTMFVAIA